MGKQTSICRQCDTWGDDSLPSYAEDMCGYCSAEGNTALVWKDAGKAIPFEEDGESWICESSHSSSGLRFEVVARTEQYARITKDGHEVVSPSPNVESVYAQYNARVQREIERVYVMHHFAYGYQLDLNAGTDKPQNWTDHCKHCDQTREGGPHF